MDSVVPTKHATSETHSVKLRERPTRTNTSCFVHKHRFGSVWFHSFAQRATGEILELTVFAKQQASRVVPAHTWSRQHIVG